MEENNTSTDKNTLTALIDYENLDSTSVLQKA